MTRCWTVCTSGDISFFFKQKTAYEMPKDWSSDVCSSDLLGSYALPRDIGARYEYSNLGGGLLGHVLARRAAEDYGTLVHRRIAGPLHMDDTTIALSSAQIGRASCRERV